MVRSRRQSASTRNGEAILGFGFTGLVLVVLGGPWVAMHVAARIDNTPSPKNNPVALVAGLWQGTTIWTTTATLVAVVVCVVVLGCVTAAAWGVNHSHRHRKAADRATPHMARAADLEHLSEQGAKAKAKRLGIEGHSAGVPLGKAVLTGRPLFSSWEDMLVLIAGPRTSKTTAYAIPQTLGAPGPCVVTSNKRDVLDATRRSRSALGQVSVFDPQGVAREPQGQCWWNPLSYVTDETKAEKLAAQFAASARTPGARTDAYFDSEAENLIGLLLLAAAEHGDPIIQIYSWLTRPSDEAAIRILEGARYILQAESLYALSHLPDKQREGVYGSARSLMGWLRSRSIVQWVTQPMAHISEFSPAAFVRNRQTLYLLSREGAGSAGPLIAALTVAVVEAAEEYATASRGGRMPVPMLCVLDEAANICRFKNLDSYYSHFGSRGIIINTILQNWAQGEEVWGRGGMEKLWSAANIKIYGGGVDDDRFLRRLSDLIGQYDQVMTSESLHKGSRTRSRSIQERTILTVSELRELPPDRAVVFPSGTPALLMEPVPWFRGPQRAQVQASINAFDPTGPAPSGTSSSASSPAPDKLRPAEPTATHNVSAWQVDTEQ
ncbi:MAG: conjugal transfer protein [Acidimicrobiales bacterium]|nr:MAG: conjugal transfer protein [Acidimicrobiales bacterium]